MMHINIPSGASLGNFGDAQQLQQQCQAIPFQPQSGPLSPNNNPLAQGLPQLTPATLLMNEVANAVANLPEVNWNIWVDKWDIAASIPAQMDLTRIKTTSDRQLILDCLTACPPIMLPLCTSLHVMVDGVAPTYEDPTNSVGGHFKISASSPAAAERIWVMIHASLIGQLFPAMPSIVGITIFRKQRSNFAIKVWLRNSKDNAAIEPIKTYLSERIDESQYTTMRFCPHKFILQTLSKQRRLQNQQGTPGAQARSVPASGSGNFQAQPQLPSPPPKQFAVPQPSPSIRTSVPTFPSHPSGQFKPSVSIPPSGSGGGLDDGKGIMGRTENGTNLNNNNNNSVAGIPNNLSIDLSFLNLEETPVAAVVTTPTPMLTGLETSYSQESDLQLSSTESIVSLTPQQMQQYQYMMLSPVSPSPWTPDQTEEDLEGELARNFMMGGANGMTSPASMASMAAYMMKMMEQSQQQQQPSLQSATSFPPSVSAPNLAAIGRAHAAAAFRPSTNSQRSASFTTPLASPSTSIPPSMSPLMINQTSLSSDSIQAYRKPNLSMVPGSRSDGSLMSTHHSLASPVGGAAAPDLFAALPQAYIKGVGSSPLPSPTPPQYSKPSNPIFVSPNSQGQMIIPQQTTPPTSNPTSPPTQSPPTTSSASASMARLAAQQPPMASPQFLLHLLQCKHAEERREALLRGLAK